MKIVKVGAIVSISEHPTAQLYTVTETLSVGNIIKAKLMYLSLEGKACNGGTVDASLLNVPTKAQLLQTY